MSDDLRDLVVKQAITEQIYSYCRGLDRMDRALALQVWHDDGLADYGSIFSGSGAEFIDWVFESHKRRSAHSHQISNILIHIDGDRAASEAYVTASLRNEGEGGVTETVARGRYADRWSVRAGRWAIDHRIYVHDFDAVIPVTEAGISSRARRDQQDPSYTVLKPNEAGRGLGDLNPDSLTGVGNLKPAAARRPT